MNNYFYSELVFILNFILSIYNFNLELISVSFPLCFLLFLPVLGFCFCGCTVDPQRVYPAHTGIRVSLFNVSSPEEIKRVQYVSQGFV